MRRPLAAAAAAVALLLTACSTSSDPKPVDLTATVTGLPAGQRLTLAVAGQTGEVVADGAFTFSKGVKVGQDYQVRVAQQPAGAHCTVRHAIGAARATGVDDVRVVCDTDPGSALMDPGALHHLRLTVTADEWDAFVLNSGRSRYVTDAFGWPSWNLWSVSEVYRRGTLEVLDEAGQVIDTVPDVGFRMRGNTSRLWPEFWAQGQDGAWTASPRRFHLNLKFDETFDGDESVYACIDQAGRPAAVYQTPCDGRIAEDIPEIPANKDRTYAGMESVALKYNKDDPSYVREALAYAVLEDRGVPAGRAVHAALDLVLTPTDRNPTFYGQPLPRTWHMGVYTLIEPIDKPFLVRRFGKNGYLFKVGGGDLSRLDPESCTPWESRGDLSVSPSFCTIGVEQPDPDDRAQWVGAAHATDPAFVNADLNDTGPRSLFSPYRATYDLKTKKSSIVQARAALRQLIAKISNPATPLAEIEALVDVDAFIRAQAVDIAVGGVDHYARVANNYYLYLSPDTGKWTYLPYDYDFAFRDTHIVSWGYDPPFRDVASTTVFAGTTARWRDRRVPESMNPILYDRIFESAANRQKLLDEVAALRHDWLDWDHRSGPVVRAWLARLEPVIAATTGGSPESGDTDYRRAAAVGDAYAYTCWVSPDSPESDAHGGPYPANQTVSGIRSDDTVKRFVQRRSAALAPEAP